MEKKTMTIKHLPTGETRLINAHKFDEKIHEAIGQKVKETPVIEGEEDEKGAKCEICGQVCKSEAGLKIHMKKHNT